MEIEEILDKESTVYIDSSAIHFHKKHHNSAGDRFIYSLDNNRIDENIKIAKDTICLLENEKAKVIPEVLDEVQHIGLFLDRTIDFREKDKRFKRIREEVSTKDYQLGMLRDDINHIMQLARQSRVRNHNPLLSKWAELTDLITHQGGINPPRKYEEYFRPYKNTDAKLVAHAMYESVHEKNSSAILTGDTDLCAILPVSFKILTSEYMKPQGDFLYKKLVENPITLYLKNTEAGNYSRAMSTDEIAAVRMFRFNNLSVYSSQNILGNIKKLFFNIPLSDISSSQFPQSLPQVV